MPNRFVKFLSHVCFVMGFVSIIGAIVIWRYWTDPMTEHGERLAIFVGLWAPTFFSLSDRYDRYAISNPHVVATSGSARVTTTSSKV